MIINLQHSLRSFQSGTDINAETFIAIQSPSTIIINNCHAQCVEGESLIILQCYDLSLNKYTLYEYTDVTKLDTNLL